MFPIGNEELFRGLVIGLALNRVFFFIFFGDLQPVGELPGVEEGGSIVFDVFYVPTSFEDEGFEAFFTKFFGGPSTADARTNHDGVETITHNLFVSLAHKYSYSTLLLP